MTLKVADRPPLVQWQLEQLEGECALLQGHAADPSCPCETDTEHCVRKHLLTIEALAKETYAMVDNEQDKEIMTDLADQSRAWRKRVEQLSLESESSPPNPPEPIKTEQHDGFQTKIFKETAEFHAGSFRTIKPREDVLVVVGCPIDSADWRGGECVCRATGERGCIEIHSLNEPIIEHHSNNPTPTIPNPDGRQETGGFTFEKKFCPACDSFQWHIQRLDIEGWMCVACRVRDLEDVVKERENANNNHPIIPLGGK